MVETDTAADRELVPGRTCGSCNVCCVALTIDDPELQKVQGYRCRNTRPDKSCGIYATRPQTCRTFYCGWRRLKWVRETLRPDRSGVLVGLQYEGAPADPVRRYRVIFTLLDNAALKADGLAESIAAAVAADIPTYLNIPGPPGYTSGQAQINDALRDAVRAKDKAALMDVLRRARAQGRAGKRIPVVLARAADSGAADSRDPLPAEPWTRP